MQLEYQYHLGALAMLLHKISALLVALLIFGSSNLNASPKSIAADLYSRYGDIRTSKGILDRQKQYSLVSNWIAQYASHDHPLSHFERLIEANTKTTNAEFKRFGCVSKAFGGYECEAVEGDKSIQLDLSKERQITSAQMCFALPHDLRSMMYSLSPKMVDFTIDLMVLGYQQQTKIFRYKKKNKLICAQSDSRLM